MYDAVPDTYCYPGTTVLINRLNLRTQKELDAFEAEITAQRADEPLPAGDFDAAHYRAIHRHLFQDVFTWAGDLRTVRMAKDGNWFCYPEYIEAELGELFSRLLEANLLHNLTEQDFARECAHFLAELNAIHAFREGNGRTQLTFLALLADQAGHPLALERLNPADMMAAMIASFHGNENPLSATIKTLLA